MTVTGPCAFGTLLGESEAVVHEHTTTTGIDHVSPRAVCRLRGNSWSETPNTSHPAPGPHRRHRSLHGPVHHIHRWLSDALMSSQVLQATQHISGLVPSVPGHELSGCQISRFRLSGMVVTHHFRIHDPEHVTNLLAITSLWPENWEKRWRHTNGMHMKTQSVHQDSVDMLIDVATLKHFQKIRSRTHFQKSNCTCCFPSFSCGPL